MNMKILSRPSALWSLLPALAVLAALLLAPGGLREGQIEIRRKKRNCHRRFGQAAAACLHTHERF